MSVFASGFAPPNYPARLHDPAAAAGLAAGRADQVQRTALSSISQPITQTTSPIVTGTSVLGIRFQDGLALAADTLASYGSLARYRDVRRLLRLGSYTMLGASGEYSDFQFLSDELDAMITQDRLLDDGAELYPKELYNYLTRVMYARRSRMNPLWNQLVIAGYREGKSFLGMVDLYGTSYEDDTVATGYGAYIARPLLRSALEKTPVAQLTQAAAVRVLEDSMRVLFYRDARALNRIQVAVIGARGAAISEPYDLQTNWEFGRDIAGH